MFTGIIQTLGKLTERKTLGVDCRLVIRAPELAMNEVALGDSIAVSGVCLTAVELFDHGFAADVSVETLDLTSLGQLQQGDAVNLELALTPASRLGGHLVTGHVDGLAKLLRRRADGRSERFDFEAPADLSRFIAAKGSVTLDGVSLTINSVAGREFSINLIPHTLEQTTLQHLGVGDAVNLEVDILARYVARLMETSQDGHGGLDLNVLRKHGFA